MTSRRLIPTRLIPVIGPVFGLALLSACDPSTAPSSTDSTGTSSVTGQGDQTAAVTSPDISANGLPQLQQQLAQSAGDRVFFDTDHWELTPADQETLRRQAAWLQQHPGLAVTIAGHGDERGTREYNLALGERRATAASNFLAALGIDKGRMTVISYGKEKPECGDAADSCWSQNRRAVTELAAQGQ